MFYCVCWLVSLGPFFGRLLLFYVFGVREMQKRKGKGNNEMKVSNSSVMTLIYFLFLRHHTVGLMMIIMVLCITVLQSKKRLWVISLSLSLTRVCR